MARTPTKHRAAKKPAQSRVPEEAVAEPAEDTKLFSTKNDLPEDKRVEVIDLLNPIGIATGAEHSADMVTGISRGVDKWLWFVEAHQQA